MAPQREDLDLAQFLALLPVMFELPFGNPALAALAVKGVDRID
jgi:hypothetical protein